MYINFHRGEAMQGNQDYEGGMSIWNVSNGSQSLQSRSYLMMSILLSGGFRSKTMVASSGDISPV